MNHAEIDFKYGDNWHTRPTYLWNSTAVVLAYGSSLRWDVSGGEDGEDGVPDGVPDGELDMSDIAFIMGNYYACSQGSPRWCEARRFDANGDGDGVVDLHDLLFIISYI